MYCMMLVKPLCPRAGLPLAGLLLRL